VTVVPPPWGTPSDAPDTTPGRPETWELRKEADGGDTHVFYSIVLEVVTGTEHDAMTRLMDHALQEASTIKPSKGYQIAQEGTTLIVTPVKPNWGAIYPRDRRFTAVRILAKVPPVEKQDKR